MANCTAGNDLGPYARPCADFEIKNLRWTDVDLSRNPSLFAEARPHAGLRSIPMNDDAYAAVMELWERASAIGGTQPRPLHIPGM